MNWSTHEITNVVEPLVDHDLYGSDAALTAAVQRQGAAWDAPRLQAHGRRLGSAEVQRWAEEANRHKPELNIFDRRGRRVDQVEFHPSWHALMALLRDAGVVSLPMESLREGRWTAHAANMYMHAQVEHGTLCPASMTTAAIPLLREEPALFAALGPKLLDRRHDPRDLPIVLKDSIWVGMGMTEKQGGSDVRSNTTRATPIGAAGRGRPYLLRGHKWFFSAPMCDAHLVVAQTDSGPGCFYVPRWRDDGSKNAVQVQRLKDKLGNASNSSSEVEFLDAHGVLMGEEGRGIRTIIAMATTTRLNCVLASAGFLRQALVQALHYTRRRRAFGRALAEQPLMRGVLADLALESEAALVLSMRLAQAFERDEAPWIRLMTPAAKFWVCKRAVEAAGEAMETFGGNGYVESDVMARLYREVPVNSIWEGSGNVMCLDMVRAAVREPQAAEALLAELGELAAGEPWLQAALDWLRQGLLARDDQIEAQGRLLAQQLVLVAQAGLLRRDAPAATADAFIATRFAQPGWGRVVGCVDVRGLDVAALLSRACPA